MLAPNSVCPPARSLLIWYGDPITLLFPPPEDLYVTLMSTNSPLIILLTSLTGTTGNASPRTNGDGSWGCLAVPSPGGGGGGVSLCLLRVDLCLHYTYNRQVQVAHIPMQIASCAKGGG